MNKEENKNKDSIIGIDLGTCLIKVAHWNDGKPQILINTQGERSTPSFVAYTEDQKLVGEPAQNQQVRNITNTIYNINKLIGRNFSKVANQQDFKKWPIKIQPSPNDQILFVVKSQGEKKKLYPQDILTSLFLAIKKSYQNVLGVRSQKVIVSVPACFNQNQRQSVLFAGRQAGLNILRLVNQTSAAVLTYAYNHEIQSEKTFLFFDFGGGKLDISIINFDDSIIQVKATVGDSQLGGEDIDNILVQYLLTEFERKYKINLSSNLKAVRRLKIQAQRVKKILSVANEATIEIDNIVENNDFQLTIKRSKFQQLCEDLFKRIITHLEQITKIYEHEGFQKIEKIDDIFMIGGSSRIPKVQQIVRKYFKNKQINKSINQDEAVACGAALYADLMTGGSQKLDKYLLIDLTTFAIGCQTVEKKMKPIIFINTTFPTKKTSKFTTFFDNQAEGLIKIYEGDRTMIDKNELIGALYVKDIPFIPQQSTQLQITVEIDHNRNISVKVKFISAGKQKIQQMTIKKTQKQGVIIKNKKVLQIKQINQVNKNEQKEDKKAQFTNQKQKMQQIPSQTSNKQTISDIDKLGLSETGLKILKQNQIKTIETLMLATQTDLIEIKIPLGDRIRIRQIKK